MSFLLDQSRPSVAFNMRTGREEVDFEVEKATCKLDIHSNQSINMGEFGLVLPGANGNFSDWVELESNQCVAVTGLASCGAVFIAKNDFSRVAAGHMGGDAHFFDGWCSALLGRGEDARNYWILWGTGPDGSRRTGGMYLLKYMERFGVVPPSRAPAVVSCGAITLVRSATTGIAYASQEPGIPFKCQGQAVRSKITPSLEEKIMQDFLMLERNFNVDDTANATANHFMLFQEVARLAHLSGTFRFSFKEQDQKQLIRDHGKEVVTAYLKILPERLQARFLSLKVFERYPELKR
ncbi:MAG: hypothetical protein K9L32_00615 [Chromatiaceae bacterium]|nr:hypothetical protein [Chromatiaceae bacterium]MCF8002707.1 hypothetical protein [Chromatiaceae bacterium]